MSEPSQNPPSVTPNVGQDEPASDLGTALGCFVIFLVVGVIVLVCVNFLITLVLFFATQEQRPPGKEGGPAPQTSVTAPETPAGTP
ncbi:MAG: hypothetical protein HUU29_05030 [Planctomycetaceae bacterium]|nr:hypothetical protein [Planctomycetaceae bacterium]